MEAGSDNVVDIDKPADSPRPRSRKWLRVLLYLLAAIGVLFIGFSIYVYANRPQGAERATIDEAAVIDSVMTDNYGKYSESKRGWLYVGEDNLTYLMRVVQQVKIPDGAAGDEMYFIASGAPIDGTQLGVLGAFHVRPDPDKPGSLVAISNTSLHGGSAAVRPEDVLFEALSETMWGWVVKVKEGQDPSEGLASVNNVVLAPQGDAIVELAQFPAAREFDLGEHCPHLRTSVPAAPKEEAAPAPDAAAAGSAAPAAAPDATATAAEAAPQEETVEEIGEGDLDPVEPCQKRRWTYRIGTVNGNIPAPIKVTVGGTYDGKPVQAKTWKLMFDSKAFRYNVPDEVAE